MDPDGINLSESSVASVEQRPEPPAVVAAAAASIQLPTKTPAADDDSEQLKVPEERVSPSFRSRRENNNHEICDETSGRIVLPRKEQEKSRAEETNCAEKPERNTPKPSAVSSGGGGTSGATTTGQGPSFKDQVQSIGTVVADLEPANVTRIERADKIRGSSSDSPSIRTGSVIAFLEKTSNVEGGAITPASSRKDESVPSYKDQVRRSPLDSSSARTRGVVDSLENTSNQIEGGTRTISGKDQVRSTSSYTTEHTSWSHSNNLNSNRDHNHSVVFANDVQLMSGPDSNSSHQILPAQALGPLGENSNERTNAPVPKSQGGTDGPATKRKVCVGVVAILVLIVGAAAGGYCGSGNCGAANQTEGARDIDTITEPPAESPTTAPTTAAAAIAIASTVAFINSIKKSAGTIVYPPPSLESVTPEALAVKWLIDDDPLQLSAENENERTRLVQRFALLALYFGTDGPAWDDNDGWLILEDECVWKGLWCDDENKINGISLIGNGLVGKLSPDVGLLESLVEIYLYENLLTGSLSESVGAWLLLEKIILYNNAMTGALPTSIASLTSLRELSLEMNRFTGPIPKDIGNLSNLSEVWLHQNKLSSTLPASIGNWTNLHKISFWDNELSGTIPQTVLGWGNIAEAYFNENDFEGAMPFCTNSSSLDFPMVEDRDVLQVDCDEVMCDCCTMC